jgi:AraC-like DNA-binding protein
VGSPGPGTNLEDAIQFLAAEAASDHAGRSALLTKLSEALFVETLRRWMTALPAEHLGWLARARDDVVGRALALLHRQPSRRWTLDALARDVGASRSTLAERFAHYLHEPPMTYLARWRLQLGARLLATTQQVCSKSRGGWVTSRRPRLTGLSGASTNYHRVAIAAQRAGEPSRHQDMPESADLHQTRRQSDGRRGGDKRVFRARCRTHGTCGH